MSYCRFENTYKDFLGCLEALEQGSITALSYSERKYAIRMVKFAREMADNYYEEALKVEAQLKDDK